MSDENVTSIGTNQLLQANQSAVNQTGNDFVLDFGDEGTNMEMKTSSIETDSLETEHIVDEGGSNSVDVDLDDKFFGGEEKNESGEMQENSVDIEEKRESDEDVNVEEYNNDFEISFDEQTTGEGHDSQRNEEVGQGENDLFNDVNQRGEVSENKDINGEENRENVTGDVIENQNDGDGVVEDNENNIFMNEQDDKENEVIGADNEGFVLDNNERKDGVPKDNLSDEIFREDNVDESISTGDNLRDIEIDSVENSKNDTFLLDDKLDSEETHDKDNVADLNEGKDVENIENDRDQMVLKNEVNDIDNNINGMTDEVEASPNNSEEYLKQPEITDLLGDSPVEFSLGDSEENVVGNNGEENESNVSDIHDNNGSMTEDNGSVTEDNSSMTEDNGSVTEDNSSITEDNGSVTEDNSSMTEDNGSITEDNGSMTEDNGSITEDNGSMTEDNGSITEDNDNFVNDDSVGNEGENFNVSLDTYKDGQNNIVKEESAGTSLSENSNEGVNDNVEGGVEINATTNVIDRNPYSESVSSTDNMTSTLSLDQILDTELNNNPQFADNSKAVPINVTNRGGLFGSKMMGIVAGIGIFVLAGITIVLAFPLRNSDRKPGSVVNTGENIQEYIDHNVASSVDETGDVQEEDIIEQDLGEMEAHTSKVIVQQPDFPDAGWEDETVLDEGFEDSNLGEPIPYICNGEDCVGGNMGGNQVRQLEVGEVMQVVLNFKSQAEIYYSQGDEMQDKKLIKYALQTISLCDNYQKQIENGEGLDEESFSSFEFKGELLLNKMEKYLIGEDYTEYLQNSYTGNDFEGKEELRDYINERENY